MTVNIETRTAWDCHSEYFEYYAFECPESWLELSKEYFTHEHGPEECAKIDWKFIKEQLTTTLEYCLNEQGLDIKSADPYRAAFYREDEDQ